MLATLLADTAAYVCGIRAMLEVVPAGCRQGGFQLLGPFVVGPGEPPHLVGGQIEFVERRPKRLAAVDRNEKLLAHLDRQSLLRVASEPCPGGVVLGLAASVAVTAFQPAGQGAMGRLTAPAAALRIGLVADLV